MPVLTKELKTKRYIYVNYYDGRFLWVSDSLMKSSISLIIVFENTSQSYFWG